MTNLLESEAKVKAGVIQATTFATMQGCYRYARVAARTSGRRVFVAKITSEGPLKNRWGWGWSKSKRRA